MNYTPMAKKAKKAKCFSSTMDIAERFSSDTVRPIWYGQTCSYPCCILSSTNYNRAVSTKKPEGIPGAIMKWAELKYKSEKAGKIPMIRPTTPFKKLQKALARLYYENQDRKRFKWPPERVIYGDNYTYEVQSEISPLYTQIIINYLEERIADPSRYRLLCKWHGFSFLVEELYFWRFDGREEPTVKNDLEVWLNQVEPLRQMVEQLLTPNTGEACLTEDEVFNILTESREG